MKGFIPTEDAEQMAIMAWADYMLNRYPCLARLIHVPNGGSRNKAEAHKLRQMGVKAGFPDLFLPIARHGYHGLMIELKRQKGGILSPAQEGWLKFLNSAGYLALRANGAEEAITILEEYLR